MKKVSELEGAELDYWVAKAEGWDFFWSKHDYFSVTEPNGNKHTLFEDYVPFDPYTGQKIKPPKASSCINSCGFYPSTDWSQGGLIIERENIGIEYCYQVHPDHPWISWKGSSDDFLSDQKFYPSDTPLISAMRTRVASKFGEEVSEIVS